MRRLESEAGQPLMGHLILEIIENVVFPEAGCAWDLLNRLLTAPRNPFTFPELLIRLDS